MRTHGTGGFVKGVKMRIFVVATAIAGILVTNASFAQDIGPGMAGNGRGILAAAERAALRVELQPNAGAQRARRSGRLKAGWTLVAVGAGLAAWGMAGVAGEGGSGTGMALSLGGLGVAGLGGVLVARADVSSQVRLSGERSRPPFSLQREGVGHTGR